MALTAPNFGQLATVNYSCVYNCCTGFSCNKRRQITVVVDRDPLDRTRKLYTSFSRRVRKIAKTACLVHHDCPVRTEDTATAGWGYMKFGIWVFFESE